MGTNAGNNGYDNKFRGQTLAELTWVAYDRYLALIKADTADAYWAFGDPLCEIRRRKRLSGEDLIDYLSETVAPDAPRLKNAMVIRDNHDRRESVAGMTPQEAFRRSSKPRGKSNGQARPRCGDRQPRTGNAPSPDRNGAERRRVIAKNTLSFSCSKVMKYLRTPKDILGKAVERVPFHRRCLRLGPEPLGRSVLDGT